MDLSNFWPEQPHHVGDYYTVGSFRGGGYSTVKSLTRSVWVAGTH